MSCLGVTGEMSESKQFEWKIPNFLSLSTEKDAFYNSPTSMFNNTSLHLIVYPGGHEEAKSGFFSLFMVNEDNCPLHVIYSLHIKKADGTLIGDKSGNAFLKPDWGYRDFYKRSKLEQNTSELVPSGNLTIVCILKSVQDENHAITTAKKMKMSATKISDYPKLIELDVLSENLRDLSANKDSCDVVLEVEGKAFKAHKTILMARSSVFAAMFQHDTLEKQTGVVKIRDCDSESFQEFLDYLYCGKLEDVSFRSALHLYITSNKYDVQKLKGFCVEYLTESLKVDNICDIVTLADKYDETKLMSKIQSFFNENMSRIFPTKEWESLMENNFRLANKLLVGYSKAKGSQ